MTRVLNTYSPEETIAAGEKIGRLLKSGDVIAFRGGMGAGKTTITRGIAAGLGLKDDVISPTFAIVNEYRRSSGLTMYHFDMYRISSVELESVGFFDCLESGGIVAVEWSENISGELPESAITISLERTGDDSRRITIIGDDRFDCIGD